MKKAGYLTEDNYPFLPHNSGYSGSCYRLWKLDLTNSQSVGGADSRTNAGHYPLVSFDRNISIGMNKTQINDLNENKITVIGPNTKLSDRKAISS